jgi:hypothetical protein
MKSSISSTDRVNLADLQSDSAEVKYCCAKNLIAIAKENPARLYPHIDTFVKLLDGDNNVLKWTAIIVIGNLARVDKEKNVDRLISKLVGFLNAGKLITANNATMALSGIAIAKPQYQKQITKELLRVEHYDYDTDECRNIAIGKVIEAIGSYSGQLKDRKAVIEFARRQTRNTRNATRKKAERFLKKLSKD